MNHKSFVKITIEGIEFEVDFIYTPAEPMVMYYPDGSGYPGSPEEVEIKHMFHKGTDFADFILSVKDYDEIEELILKQLHA